MKKTLVIYIVCIATLSQSCRRGCKDPNALNYDSDAVQDCCCIYGPIERDGHGPCDGGPWPCIKSGFITTDETWSDDIIHELAGKVVVTAGATLTIEPGTIIKGRTGTGTLASALVIAQDGKINACGTATHPIIFTSELDNIGIGEISGSNLTEYDTEKWGGLVILGNAPVSTADGDVVGHLSGIPAEDSYGTYGGNDATHSSGSLCYVSIRHGGALIGDGNKINGLTLGGVGSGTSINQIEVIANVDDGIECYGGTVNLSNVIVGYCEDDGIDLDQNYAGTITDFGILNEGNGSAIEVDGPEGTTNVSGNFTLNNGTVWTNSGNGFGSTFRASAQGTISNTFWNGWNMNSIRIRASFLDTTDVNSLTPDAYSNLVTPSTPAQLIFTGIEVVGTAPLDDQVIVYTNSMDGTSLTDLLEPDAQAAVGGASIIVTGPGSVGTDLSQFSWTWLSTNAKL